MGFDVQKGISCPRFSGWSSVRKDIFHGYTRDFPPMLELLLKDRSIRNLRARNPSFTTACCCVAVLVVDAEQWMYDMYPPVSVAVGKQTYDTMSPYLGSFNGVKPVRRREATTRRKKKNKKRCGYLYLYLLFSTTCPNCFMFLVSN